MWVDILGGRGGGGETTEGGKGLETVDDGSVKR